MADSVKICEKIGFDYLGPIIWRKTSNCFLTGGSNNGGKSMVMGSYPYPRNGIVKKDYELIHIFKKLGKSPRPSQ
ncbi:MAG: hypothetical protein ACOC5T_02705 [Elusimicrobiota bacterium]